MPGQKPTTTRIRAAIDALQGEFALTSRASTCRQTSRFSHFQSTKMTHAARKIESRSHYRGPSPIFAGATTEGKSGFDVLTNSHNHPQLEYPLSGHQIRSDDLTHAPPVKTHRHTWRITHHDFTNLANPKFGMPHFHSAAQRVFV